MRGFFPRRGDWWRGLVAVPVAVADIMGAVRSCGPPALAVTI